MEEVTHKRYVGSVSIDALRPSFYAYINPNHFWMADERVGATG